MYSDALGAQPAERPGATEVLATQVLDEELAEASLGEEVREIAEHLKIPVVDNGHVQKWIRYFTVKDRERFQRFLNRGNKYRDVIETMLEENDLPAELYYLAMIESGFRTDAYSVAKAAGVWQFIPGTATRYGLRVDRFVDERRDPIRSTEAAAKYLRDLYNAFGSWHLAMAAYNAGEMRVLRAIFRGKSRDFWQLVEKGVLPRETANYVPKFIAVVVIGMDPEQYGFKVEDSAKFPDVEAFALPGSLPLAAIAPRSGMSLADLKRLNPHIKNVRTPIAKGYELWLPSHALSQVKQNEKKLLLAAKRYPRAEGNRAPAAATAFHRVRRGENLSFIARRYKMSIGYLRRLNGLRGSRVLVGQELRVKSSFYRGSKIVRYKVRRGDNLIAISKRFGVPVWRIKNSNRIKSSKIMVGQTLKFASSTKPM